jgi:hypothetical protein
MKGPAYARSCSGPRGRRAPAHDTSLPPQVVYDPAVLVRGELTVLFGRYVRGHLAAVREAMVAQQRKLEEAAAQVGAPGESLSC